MCGGHRKHPASDDDDALIATNGAGAGSLTGGAAPVTFFTAGLQPPLMKASELMASAPAAAEPVVVYTGPTRTGADLVAAVAADTDQQATPKARGKKSRVAKKPDAKTDAKTDTKTAAAKPADTKSDAKTEAKTAAKPAGTKHAAAKPDAAAKPAGDKPAANGDQAAKPAKPKAATKPKPAPNNS
jgi:D-alanyl-D-alanine carboxypeptidase